MEVFAEKNFIMTNEQYQSGIKVEEYNGTYSLVSAWINQEEEVRLKWGYIEKDKKPGKKLPIKVELGSREEAIRVLQSALRLLNAEPDGPMELPEHPQDGSQPAYDDVPW